MRRLVAGITVLLALLAAAARVDPIHDGLNGSYFANAGWSGPPAVSTRDPQLSSERLAEAWRGAPPERFTVSWTGWVLVLRDGPYTLATISDGSSWVDVDGQVVVDNGGARESVRGATGSITLTRGVHALHVRYAHEGSGPSHLDLLWARAGQPLERIPGWAMTPRRLAFWSVALSAALRQALAGAEWLWVAVVVAWALAFAWSGMARGKAWLERERVWSTLKWILAASLILNLAAIWWGLPGGAWAPDELSPLQVIEAAAQRFTHGWFDRYPPFHYYMLTAVFSPLMLLEWLGRVDLTADTPYAVLTLLSRLVSLAAGLGTLLAVYACGARRFGRRAGVWAAAMFACVTPFVYYAKTANLDVPYLFWFALSMVFYLRVLHAVTLRDATAFAACAMLAICTKDQAYGLYLLMPCAIVEAAWRANRRAAMAHPLRRAVFDPRLWTAAAVGVAVFVAIHNIIFNLHGFEDHVRLITGPASETYRAFDPDVLGRLALFRLTLTIVRVAWGWPMVLASLAGVVMAVVTPRHRRVALWLLLPAISYYLAFINVVLYNYDRFMLPVCLLLSLFGGLALDRWLSARLPARRWRVAGAGAVLAYSMLYAATVDLAMLRDSRYTVEQWLVQHAGAGTTVGYVFPPQYYPRLDRFNSFPIASASELAASRPEYYVLNADYARAEPVASDIGKLIAGLQNGASGYSLVFRYRRPAPWPWIPGAPRDLVGGRNEQPVTSVLRQINPWYEVFSRSK